MEISKEYRILGIDDGHFSKEDKTVVVIGTIFRGGDWMDGILSTRVDIDGTNSTDQLIKLIKQTKHFDQLRCIMINGIALGGFNVVDIQKLGDKTKLPVIVIVRKKPDFKRIKIALKKAGTPEKFSLMIKAGEVYCTSVKDREVCFQITGIGKGNAERIIKMSATRSLVPEPLRAAHLIASGITTTGENTKRV